MLDGSTTIKVKPGSTVKVELLRRKLSIAQAAALPRLPGAVDVAPNRNAARFAFYDLGTFYALTGDNESSYQETVTESDGGWSDGDRAIVRNEYVASLTTATVGGSNRTIETCMRMQSDSDETDGCITAMTLKQNGVSRRYDMIAASEQWTEQVPAATRLAALGFLPSGASNQAVSAAIAATTAEGLESWDAWSRHRTGTDGTMVAALPDGRYSIAIESPRHFYPFDTSDTTAFKVTEGPTAGYPEASIPEVVCGDHQSTSVDVFLVPQMYQTLIQWYTRYFYQTLFSYGDFIIPQTGTYIARLPFYPQRYSLSFAGTLTNAVAMSLRIMRTQTYARMILQDLALEVVTQFFSLTLINRFNGRWTLYQREIPEGQLVGVLRFRYQGGPSILRYVWRRTTLSRPFIAVDSGPLDVPGEVTGDDGLVVVELP